MTTRALLPGAACIGIAIIVSGCASTGSAPVPFDPDQSTSAQAHAFIGTRHEQYMSGVDKVGITACNVMFAIQASAHAGTSPGLFATAGGGGRGEARVSTIFTLKGLEEADMQRTADAVCADAERKLVDAGYQVVPHSELKNNEDFQQLQAAGKESPFQYKSGDSRYLVFARSGDSVFDERYIGTASGLGQAFKAAAGGAAWQREAVALESLGITGINLNILIDFAQMSSDGDSGLLGGLASKDTAQVSGEVLLSATGGITVKPHARLNCWDRFGKHECMVDANKQPIFETSRSISLQEPFYTGVEETTTKGDKIAAGVTAALSLLGGTKSSVTRHEVTVTPQTYAKVQQRITDGLLDMAISRATEYR